MIMNPLLVKEAASALLTSGGRSSMKNLLAMAAAGLLIFAGLGWYLDWYKVQRGTGADGQPNVTVGINTNEIRKDIGVVRDRAGQIFTGRPGTYTGAPTQPTYPTSYPPQSYPQYPQYPQYPTPSYPQQPYQPGYQQGQSNWVPSQPQPTYPGGYAPQQRPF
jgi:hypothetical protein